MGDDLVTDASLRQFLLGQLDEEEQLQIERLFITDSHTRDRILLAEQDLIEAYLEGSLTEADREAFLHQYTATPALRRKLSITKSIKERAVSEVIAPRTVPSAVHIWNRLGEWLRPRFVLVGSVAAAVIIGIMTAGIWLKSKVERRNRQLAIAEEVARLNAPSSWREAPPQMSSLELRPVSFRSGESLPELMKNSLVELRLHWTQPEQYPNYRAVVQRVGDEPVPPVNGLHAESDGKTIRLRLPPDFLTRGTYRVELTGIAADGSTSLPEEYQFTVRG